MCDVGESRECLCYELKLLAARDASLGCFRKRQGSKKKVMMVINKYIDPVSSDQISSAPPRSCDMIGSLRRLASVTISE